MKQFEAQNSRHIDLTIAKKNFFPKFRKFKVFKQNSLRKRPQNLVLKSPRKEAFT